MNVPALAVVEDARPNCNWWLPVARCPEGWVATGAMAHYGEPGPMQVEEHLEGIQLVCLEVVEVWR